MCAVCGTNKFRMGASISMDRATAANQQTTAACLHTRSLPAASTRRGVAGSTSAEYESERKEKTNRRRTNHTKSDGAWRGNDRSQQ